MDDAAGTVGGDALRSRRRTRPQRRGRLSVVGVLGELLLTAGVVVLLYVAWQMWIGDLILGAQYRAEGSAISEQWARETAPLDDDPAAQETPSPSATASEEPSVVAPPTVAEPGSGEIFGVMHIPRFGPDYAWTLRGGVLGYESIDIGAIGHYPGTAMPGQAGNFAVAGHRGGDGAAFFDLDALRIGDAVVVETESGWYTYRFRNFEYVAPDGVGVLSSVPQLQDVQANESYITMTTCSPLYGNSERLIAYGVFESFTPREAGEPASLGPAEGA